MDRRLIFRSSQGSFDDGETQKDKHAALWLLRLLHVSWIRQANPPGLNSEVQRCSVWGISCRFHAAEKNL